MSVRIRVVKLLPPSFRLRLRKAREAMALLKCGFYDLGRYLRYSASVDPYASKRSFQAIIQKRQHIVEKGLSLPQPRPGFGVENILLLTDEVDRYVEKYGSDPLVESCVGALKTYHAFTVKAGGTSPVPIALLAKIEERTKVKHLKDGGECAGGVDVIHAAEIEQASAGCFAELARSRRSIRNFQRDAIPISTIEEAVRLAQYTPSVCNRQAWRVHCYQGYACGPILAIQTGNRGFNETIGNFLVVTCHLSAFMSAGERNQAYIDGGLFAMSLVYALQSKGIGSCCLNLCLEPAADVCFHSVGKIPPEEVLIMGIAIGFLPEVLSVAQSKRNRIEDVFVVHCEIEKPAP